MTPATSEVPTGPRHPRAGSVETVLRGRPLEFALWAILACWAVAFVALGYPWTAVGFFTDGQTYLLIADALTNGVTHPDSAYGAYALREGRFPPGYPLLLSLFGADRSAHGMQMANIAQMGSVALMLAVCYGYLRQRAGTRIAALCGVGCLASLPFIQPWSLELTSEPLFTAMIVAICWLGCASKLPRRWLWMALLLGLATLVRTHGIVIVPALALWILASTRSWPRALAGAALAAAPALAWQMFQKSSGQTVDGSYLGHLAFGGGFAALLQLLFENLVAASRAFAPREFHPLAGTGFVLLIAAIALKASLRWRWPPDLGLMTLLSLLAALLLWPFPDHMERLAGPAAPLLLALVLARDPATTHPTPPSGSPVAWEMARTGACLLFVVALAASSVKFVRANFAIADPSLRIYARNVVAHNRDNPQAQLENYHRILLLAEAADQIVPADECMTATIPTLIMLRSRSRIRKMPYPFSWEANACNYVLATNTATPADQIPALYPLDVNFKDAELVIVSRFADGNLAGALLRRPQAKD